MERSRSKKLRDLVISKEDLRAISDLLHKYHDADALRVGDLPEWARPSPPSVSVNSEGSMRTTDTSSAIFLNDDIDRHKTISINFRYSTRSPAHRSIEVDLKEGDSDYSNSYSVSGDDPNWVDAAYAELERIFGSIRPQKSWFITYKPLITGALAIALGYLFILIWYPILDDGKPPNESSALRIFFKTHEAARWLALGLVYWLSGIGGALFITGWVRNLWPSIEFDFGPEHKKVSKEKRIRLGILFTLLVLPILLTAFQRLALGWK